MSSEETTVSHYILSRLKEIGCDHIFGVPGDFVLEFFDVLHKSDQVKYVGTCNELNAAHAADGYARIKGIGCVSTTYAVGELSAINGVAGSFAERVPVVVLTGSPTTVAQQRQPLLHHTLGDYNIPKKMYDLITCASTVLNNPQRAPEEIDRVLRACIKEQKPVYISLPGDLVHSKCPKPSGKLIHDEIFATDTDALSEALEEAAAMIEKSTRPVIIADVELKRYHLENEFRHFIDKTGLPFAVLMMGKTVIEEEHHQFIGLYQGDRSRKYVQDRIDTSDCVIQLGVMLTDFNSGGFTVNIESKRTIRVNYNTVHIKNHSYEQVFMKDFLHGLASKLKHRIPDHLDIHRASEGCAHNRSKAFQPNLSAPMTVQRFFDRITHFLPENSIIVAETGVSLFTAAETFMPKGATFIGQIFYGSIGYTVGAALGAAVAAPNRRVILFIGDGSFQVTCQDLSTMIRNKLNTTIFLLNNDGYTIERVIVDGPYNDIQMWKYHKLPEVFGGSKGDDVKTEGELEEALKRATGKELSFIEIHTERMDCTESLRKAGQSMASAFSVISK